MPTIKDVNNIENTVVIGKNHIKFKNEILKISNISRTWIFKFQNIEKIKFEQEKQAYENAKVRYEQDEIQKNRENIKNILIAAAILLLISIVALLSRSVAIGILFLCIAGILAYVAYQIYQREPYYPYSPPTERKFPDKYGLGIEMNSGYVVTFAAIGDDGLQALRELQNDIEEADENNNIYFNLNENNITVEKNDGVINTGDYANNSYQRGGQGNL